MIIFLTFDTKEECDKFIYLYSHYLNTVYYTVTRFVSEPYTIEDLSQDVFLLLSKHRLTMVNTPLNKALGVRNQIFHSNDTRSAVA